MASAGKEEPEEGEVPLTVASGPIGSVQPTMRSILEGQEVGDDELRATEMTDQVGKFVDEDPAAVAHLIQRWTDVND